ncbi:MAG: polysaccharide biosynthesis protein [Clostridia bacterium]|nr:polysaccharide biosynthesis protein [Clostridia bacterium]
MLKNRRKLLLILIDSTIFTAVYAFCVLMQLVAPNSIKMSFDRQILNYLVCFACLMLTRFFIRVYRNVWRYADPFTYLEVLVADLAGGILALTVTYFTKNSEYSLYVGFWFTVAVIAASYIATLSSRLVYQQYYKNLNANDHGKTKTNVAIVGAGQTGSLLAEDLERNPNSTYHAACYIDTDKGKIGGSILGLPIYAPDDKLVEKLQKLGVKEIIIALPKMGNEGKKRIIDFYIRLGFKVKIYDFQFTEDDEEPTSKERVIKDVRIEDLLFRNSIKVFDKNSRSFYTDKTVIVTGGGGSIGSELCRQIAKCKPKRLIIFDIYENNAYDIQQELVRKYGAELDLVVEIGSVRDRARLEAVFAFYRPDLVFHAAAHKHVPLMEHSNCEAIKNNCLGTYNTADMAEKYGVSKFILISTDKAVNPTNVMGASKRMCEMIIQCRKDSRTEFAAVRFGNVLGSNGSVIPLFKSQIAMGGPVTITDKRIIRYFMTIPEAAGLVLSAGAMANGGDLFVLDMGKPVKILDLAENMIHLSGFRPYIDIEIKEIGLRPGEKLYEELLIKTENLAMTDNELIFIEHDTPLSREEVDERIDLLRRAVAEAENEIGAASVTAAMKSVVPTFVSPEEVNKTASESVEMQLAETPEP